MYLVYILVELGAFFLMFLFHCFNMLYQHLVLPFKCGYALLQFFPFRFQLIASQKRTDLCHECRFRLGLGGFQLLRLDFLFNFIKQPFRLLLLGLQLPYVGFKLSRLPVKRLLPRMSAIRIWMNKENTNDPKDSVIPNDNDDNN